MNLYSGPVHNGHTPPPKDPGSEAPFSKSAIAVLFVLVGLLRATSPAFTAVDCRPERQPWPIPNGMRVTGDLTFSPGQKVRGPIVFAGAEASGSTLDCQGATIEGGTDTIVIMPTKSGSGLNARYSPPKNVTIRGCKIKGSVRIWGMGPNANGGEMCQSSRTLDHVARARRNAASGVRLEGLTITANGRIPLYVGPGVSDTTLIDSTIEGSTVLAIYLGAESTRTTIRDNRIHPNTTRELIAIDASSNNRIINNRFSNLSHGGIYLYRNCGEYGTIRHSPPAHNQIINNVFYYNRYRGSNPSVFLGSRTVHDGLFDDGPGYCPDDRGFPFGSSVSNWDYARHNVVMQNRIYKRSIADMIRTSYINTKSGPRIDQPNDPNYIAHNETVTAAAKRPAGCYVRDGFGTNFLLHGESLSVFRINGGPRCNGRQLTCNDGEITSSSRPLCRIEKEELSCQVTGDNDGCRKVAWCPSGTSIVGAVAACNLEYGTVSRAAVDSTPIGVLRVERVSDRREDGSCYVGATTRVSSGQTEIVDVARARGVYVGCQEHDRNGGDCHIRGHLYCVSQ